jgi:hypothetical protein
MDNNNKKDDKEKGGWLQSTANLFIIVEAVINIVSHLTQIYRNYNDITKENVHPNVNNNNIADGEDDREYDNPNNMRSPAYPLNPPEDIETENEEDSCKVCMTNKIRTVNLPCGHLVFCFACCTNFITNNYTHNCPICREKIKEIKIIYN